MGRAKWGGVIATVLAVAVAAGISAGCKPKGPPRNIFIMYKTEPSYIDPYNAQETQGVQVVNDVFDSLVAFDPITSQLKPAAATSWSSNKDFTVWTFKLNPADKFHNGRAVKTSDFVYAFNRIANPADKTIPAPSDISYHLAPVLGFDKCQASTSTPIPLEGVKALDDLTLQITLSYPFADFKYVVGHPALAPVPPEALDTPAKAKAFADMPIGNGPFMMAEPWKHNQYIKVKAFPGYYGQKAKLAGVEYKLFKDEQAAFLDFQAGKIDWTESIPTGQIKSTVAQFGKSADGYTAQPGGDVLLGAETATYYLNINNQNKPTVPAVKALSDPRVRAAISLAINRQNICDTVYEGTRKPATGLVPPGVVGFLPNEGKYCKYDPEAAKKLLAAAGYPGGKGLPSLQISFNTGAGHENVMQAVQANLKDIGINSTLNGMEWAQFVKYRQDGKHQLARDGWIFDYPIIDNMLYPLFYSKNVGKDNSSRYVNPKVDALLVSARKTSDDAQRSKLYEQAERLILDDAGAAPIDFYAHRGAAQKWVKGLVYSPLGLIDSNMVSFTQAPPAQ